MEKTIEQASIFKEELTEILIEGEGCKPFLHSDRKRFPGGYSYDQYEGNERKRKPRLPS